VDPPHISNRPVKQGDPFATDEPLYSILLLLLLITKPFRLIDRGCELGLRVLAVESVASTVRVGDSQPMKALAATILALTRILQAGEDHNPRTDICSPSQMVHHPEATDNPYGPSRVSRVDGSKTHPAAIFEVFRKMCCRRVRLAWLFCLGITAFSRR